MKVGNLIRELQQYNPHAPVCFATPTKEGAAWRQQLVLGTFKSDSSTAVNIHADYGTSLQKLQSPDKERNDG